MMAPYKFLGEDRHIDAAVHMDIERRGGNWAVYQNVELGHPEAGHLKFLKIGELCTYQEAPSRLPDTATDINWRYLHVGWVDLKTGLVIDQAPFPNGKEPPAQVQDGSTVQSQAERGDQKSEEPSSSKVGEGGSDGHS